MMSLLCTSCVINAVSDFLSIDFRLSLLIVLTSYMRVSFAYVSISTTANGFSSMSKNAASTHSVKLSMEATAIA